MYLIKNLKDVSESKINILIKDNKLMKVFNDQQAKVFITKHPHFQIYEFKKTTYVSAGWIDIHTHCYKKSPIYYADPDLIGYQSGSTLIVDSGSAGYLDIEDFYKAQKNSKTNVKALLNISDLGLAQQDELSDQKYLNADNIEKVIQKYSNFIIGFKMRLSNSVIGNNHINPLLWFNAERTKRKWTLPLMVHVGNTPPSFKDIVAQLRPNDIITHIFHGKNNEIVSKNFMPTNALNMAFSKKINLDLGHGSDSFSYVVAKNFLKTYQKDILTTISTDLYYTNQKNKVVESLALTMSKMLNLGYSLSDVIIKVTKNPAKILNLSEYGTMNVGQIANLTFFTLENSNRKVVDSDNNEFNLQHEIKSLGVVLNGEFIVKGDLWNRIFTRKLDAHKL